MLSRIEAGINSYRADFGTYPGVFSGPQLLGTSSGTIPNPPQVINGSNNPPLTGVLPVGFVTSSENLYLSLTGGLTYTPALGGGPAAFVYNSANAQNNSGPGNLNAANTKRFGCYMTVVIDETTLQQGANVTQPSNPAGVWCVPAGSIGGDTNVPEYLDKYATPSPILYMRAVAGAPGKAIGGVTSMVDYTNATSATVFVGDYQYQPALVTTTYAGPHDAQNMAWQPGKALTPTPPFDNGALSATQQQIASYFGNASSSSSSNFVAASRDGYLLISAGPDGIYGTSDDITNFR